MVWYNYNGKISESDNFLISSNNRAFKYGDGFFETIKVEDGHALRLELHHERMLRANTIFKFSSFAFSNIDLLHDQISNLFESHPKHALGRLRISIFRSDGGLYLPLNKNSDFLMEYVRIDEKAKPKNDFKLGIYNDIKKPINILSPFKVIGSHWNIFASMFAEEMNYNDAIILNEHGNICETTHSNIFFAKDNIIHTPDLESGCVDGTFRRNYIQNSGLEIIERPIHPSELGDFDKAYTSNAISGLTEVTQIENSSKFIFMYN